MADDIKINPNPIQRNAFDVAVELTELYRSYHRFESVQDLQETFTKFYATAYVCKSCSAEKLLDYCEC
ncbi:MAG: hypothetical protein ACYDG2_05805 [Ruminiclostridium sp.]